MPVSSAARSISSNRASIRVRLWNLITGWASSCATWRHSRPSPSTARSAARQRRSATPQSAVSQQLATLERLVGQRLVDRPGGPRPAELTEAGRMLLRPRRRDRRAAPGGPRRPVGARRRRGGRAAGGRLPERRRAPPARSSCAGSPRRGRACEVSLTEAEDDVLVAALEAGDLDLAFLVLPDRIGADRDDRAPARPVRARDPDRIAARPPAARRPASARSGVCRSSATGRASGRGRSRRACARPASSRTFAFRSDDNATIQEMVAAGMGVALIPRLTVNEARLARDPRRPRGPHAAAAHRARVAPRPLPAARGRGVHRGGARPLPRARGRRVAQRAGGSSGSGRPKLPSSTTSRRKNSPTVQSLTTRSRRLMSGSWYRW